MRLLAVRGRNLASLAEPFEVTFDRGPLAAAGLFAITGETGSGKSTLLDALCLALYGAFPRLAAGDAQENIADVSGELTRADRPQSILRRGAAEAFAEVDFIALDGAPWRVRWAIRRARGKASGRLQNAEHTLVALAPESAQAALSGTAQVKARIEELTGLTFSQFCRTALLAQGEFDAFLRADVKERAALLEMITGTDLYRRLSKRVYEEDVAVSGIVRALEVRRDAIGLMEDEPRAALAAERRHLIAEEAAAAGERAAIDAGLDRHRLHGEALDALARAQATAARRDAEREALAPEAAQLAALEAAAPFRAIFATLAGEDAALATATGRVEAARAVCRSGEEAEARARAALATAAAAHAGVRAEGERLVPLWDEAARLDGAVATAMREAAAAREAHAGAAAGAEAAAAHARRLAGALGEQEARHAALAAQRTALTGLETVAARAEDLAALAGRHEQARDEAQAATARAAGARQTAAALTAQIAAAHARLQQDEAALHDLAPALAAAQNDLRRLDEAGLSAAAADLNAAATRLGTALEATAALSAATGRAAESRTALATAGQTLEAAGARHAQAAAARLRAEGARSSTRQALQLAEGTASEAAARLRAELEPGQPCPVCGATDHPGHATGSLAAMVESFRSRNADAEAALAAAEADERAADSALARAAAARDRAAQLVDDAAAALTDAGRQCHAALRGAGEAVRRAAAGLLPAATETAKTATAGTAAEIDFTAAGEETLRAVLTAVEEARAATAESLEALRRRRRESDALTERRAALQSRLADTQRTLAGLAGRHADAVHEGDLAEAAAAGAGRQAEEARAQLAGPLEALVQAGRLAAGAGAPACAAALRALAGEFATLAAAERSVRDDLESLRPDCSAAAATAATQAAAAEAAAGQMQQRRQALEELERTRAGLLEGTATEAHRSAFGARLRAADTAERAAQAGVQAAGQHLAAARTGLASACERLAEAKAGRAGARLALDEALQAAGLSEADVAARLATPDTVLARLRGHLQQAGEAVRDAAATVEAAQQRLAGLIAEGLPAEDAPALEARRAAAQAAATARQQRLGAIAEQMRQDDEARQRAADLAGEIAAARDRAAVWKAVSEAVGSASGDKFQRFAQGLTLDSLIHLANRHLAVLKPRYRLARAASELGLQVEDREMAGEVRSTRSLSGGERFLVSLALALALSALEGRQSFVDMLFIDEGFGSLDAASLDIAIDALETLQAQGRKVGVVSHVQAMKDRIPVQIRIERQGADRSRIVVTAAGAQ